MIEIEQVLLQTTDLEAGARDLSDLHLQKQKTDILYVLQILNDKYALFAHPTVKTWNGYTEALVEYGIVCCDESDKRGLGNSTTYRERFLRYSWGGEVKFPPHIKVEN